MGKHLKLRLNGLRLSILLRPCTKVFAGEHFKLLARLPPILCFRRCPARTATDQEVHKTLEYRTSTAPDKALFNDPRIDEFPCGVVALLHKVLQDGSSTFLSKLARPGNARTLSSLCKAPCNGLCINLSSQPLSNGGKARNS